MRATAPDAGAWPPLVGLRRSLALVWLVYDALDLGLGATRDMVGGGAHGLGVSAAQAALVLLEAAWFAGVRPQLAALGCFAARAALASLFGLNDFYYAAVMALWLACDRGEAAEGRRLQRLLLVQTAWIYAATAGLKLNPGWLRGGHLFVRQQYLLASRGWPYPAWYGRCLDALPCQAWLARAGIAGELTLAALLLLLATAAAGRGRWRARLAGAAVALAAALHAFGAVALNVWFFGASMVAQVFWLTRPPAAAARLAPPPRPQ